MARSWGYTNGNIPLSAGVVVRGEYFQPDAGAHLVQLLEAYEDTFGYQFPIVQGYRPLGQPSDPANPSASTQFVAWNYYQQDTKRHPVAARPLLIGGVWVGTSGHGQMLAADVGGRAGLFNTAEHQWLVDHAPAYGWEWGGTPSEAWHIDYVGPITITAATIAAGGAAHLLSPAEPQIIVLEDEMNIYRAVTASSDGRIGLGYIYVQDADGPLRAVDNSEGSLILAKERKNLVFIADWNGDDIRSLITRVGILEYEAMPDGLRMTTGTPLLGPGKLTGRIIYDNASLPNYPKVSVA